LTAAVIRIVSRIFLSLSIVSGLGVIAAFILGYTIDDPTVADRVVQTWVSYHMLTGLAAILFAILAHALVFTYFMGTGRWIEETATTYRLTDQFLLRHQKLKYRALAAMMSCVLLLMGVAILGAASDPASAVALKDLAGVPTHSVHFAAAACGIVMHFACSGWEWMCLRRSGRIVDAVMAEVKRIRTERGYET
jgi:hypothetical protein